MTEIDTGIIIAIVSYLVLRIEMVCRTQKLHLKLAKLAHPQLYEKIFGNRHD